MKKAINIDIGNRIKEKRKSLGYTREVFSEMADITPQFLASVEQGMKGLSIQNLINICNLLHVSTDYILTGFTHSSNEKISNILNTLDTLDETELDLVIESLGTFCKLMNYEKKSNY